MPVCMSIMLFLLSTAVIKLQEQSTVNCDICKQGHPRAIKPEDHAMYNYLQLKAGKHCVCMYCGGFVEGKMCAMWLLRFTMIQSLL